jgi:hypothetical protein
MVAATDDVWKYDATRARVLANTTLLEEKEHAAVVLTKEAHATAALIEPPSPTPPPAPAGRAAPSDDDYEDTAIANIHVQGAGVQNIHSLISVTLDLSFVHYARWDWMGSVVKSWIWGTISPGLQDVVRQCGHTLVTPGWH